MEGFEDLKLALDTILQSKVDSGELVGIVLLVRKDGIPVYEGAAGWADREAQRPMDLNALFRLASVSKSFTAMAAGALISKGQLGLDDPVGKYLKAFSSDNPKLKDKRALDILVRHLLSHQAGFSYVFGERAGGPYHQAKVSDGCESNPGLTLEENMERIASAPLLYQPGTKYEYSVASDVLGAVVSSAYGNTLQESMDELVLKPLNIVDTGFYALNPSILTSHYRSQGKKARKMSDPELFNLKNTRVLTLSPGRALDQNEFPSGGCGMVASAQSVMTLLEAVREDGGTIVSPKVMEGFYKDAIAPRTSSPGEGFGASWAVVLNPKTAKLPVSPGTIHWGGVYGHNWYVDREKGITVVILTNTALKGLYGNLKDQVLKVVYQALKNLPKT
jgi:CubicO group peptidase (beta-lactamase class C family)